MSVVVNGWSAPAVRTQRPTLLWCYALLAPAMIFILTSVDRGYQTDLWHHLARGREILRTGRLVNRDVFTFTVAGERIVDNNWLTQIVGYKLYEWGGLDLLQAANSLLLALTVAGLIRIGLRRGAPARVTALIGVAVVAGLAPTLLIRPQTISMFLFVALMAILLRASERPRRLILAPCVMMLWANVHGAFPIGLVLIGCFTVAAIIDALRVRRRTRQAASGRPALASRRNAFPITLRPTPREMIACLVASALATLINPYGWTVYRYVLTTSMRAHSRVIQEWLRPEVFSMPGAVWIGSIAALCVLAVVGRRQVRMTSAVVAVAFAAISCTSVRMSIWWYLAAAPVAMTIWPRRRDAGGKPSLAAAALYAAIVAAMTLSLPALSRYNPAFRLRPSDRPEATLAGLADAVTQHAPGARVFSRLEWGEYLSFALPWKHSIFMDGRIEIYPDGLWDEYRRITSADAGWQQLLDRHGVTVLVLDRHYHDGLIAAVSQSPAWHELSNVGGGVVFVRNDR
jgi:hypothetical protein